MSLESKLVLADFLDSETSWVLAGAKRRRETQPEDDDGASRLVGMPERESLGPKLVRSRFRSRSCGDSPEPVKANRRQHYRGDGCASRVVLAAGRSAARPPLTCYLNPRLPRL